MTEPAKSASFSGWVAEFEEETGINGRIVDAVARPLVLDRGTGAANLDAWLAVKPGSPPTSEERVILEGCWKWLHPAKAETVPGGKPGKSSKT